MTLSAGELRDTLKALRGEDRAVSICMESTSRALVVQAVLDGDELWLTDCGGTFASLASLDAPLMDEQAAVAVCGEHGTELSFDDGLPWISRRMSDGESLTVALEQLERTMDTFLVASRLHDVTAGDPSTATGRD
jgi:hypothetical protein